MSADRPPEPEADAAQVFALRQTFWRNGFRPVAVYTKQKRPRGNGWLADAMTDPPLWATRQPEEEALSTGLACGRLAGIDVDVRIQAVVDRIIYHTEKELGPTPLVRIGYAPKTLIAYRADAPFRKLATETFIMPDGTEAKVEMLADGQQFVADGIHPDTGQPYLWPAGSPETVPLANVPPITFEQAQALVAKARELIIANGGVEKKPPPPRQQQSTAAGADSFFAAVNAAALSNLAAWVKQLFPKAVYQRGTGSWRVTAKDRGRPDLEEDVSLHPDGIQDFGCEQGLSPIDVVIQFGAAADPVASAHWLCERLGIQPVTLGWHNGAPDRRTPLAKMLPTLSGGPHLDDNRTGEDLERLARQTQEYRQELPPTPDGEVQIVRGTIRPLTTIPPRQWAYGKFLLFGSAACIGGMDGAGKGMLATAMALAMITGYPLLGEKVWRNGPVAIITYEDDQDEWERRIAAACLHYSQNGYNLDYETLIGSFYFLHKPGGRVTLAERTKENGLQFPDTARIVHFLKKISAVMLIIDPFNSAHAMEDGNNNVAIASVAQEITAIAQQAHVAALLLHHLRKGATGTVDDLMGAVALRANFRSVRILQVASEGDAIGLGIPVAEAWRYLWVAGSKENYAPPPLERLWFHKASQKLNNPGGIYELGDEVGAIGRWTPPAAFEGLDYASLRAVFDALAAGPHAADKRAKAVPWAGQPLMELAGRNTEQATKILNQWLKNKTLVPGEPFETGQRREIKTLVLDPAKVADILGRHAAAGNPQETAND